MTAKVEIQDKLFKRAEKAATYIGEDLERLVADAVREKVEQIERDHQVIAERAARGSKKAFLAVLDKAANVDEPAGKKKRA